MVMSTGEMAMQWVWGFWLMALQSKTATKVKVRSESIHNVARDATLRY